MATLHGSGGPPITPNAEEFCLSMVSVLGISKIQYSICIEFNIFLMKYQGINCKIP